MPQRLQWTDFVKRFPNGNLIQTVLKPRIEANLQMGRRDLLRHAERIRIALDNRGVVLQRERHAEITGERGCFRERLTAPVPGLLLREVVVFRLPDSLRNIIPAAAGRQERDAGPAKKHTHDSRAQIGCHAHQLAQIDQLTFTMLRDGAAEIVVSGNSVDLNALVSGKLPYVLA